MSIVSSLSQSTHQAPSYATLKNILDDYIRTTNPDAPTDYIVISFFKADTSELAVDIWCWVIDPPVQDDANNPVNHVAIVKSGDRWTGLFFAAADRSIENWHDAGCGSW